MATRKQRARRAKTFRHEYGLVTYDEEGNEVEVDAAELRPKKDKPAKAKATSGRGSGKARSSRPVRDPQPPSWNRSLKRGGMWGGLTIVASVFLLQGTPLPGRIAIGALYALMFIPLTYWLDGVIYRRWARQQAGGSSNRQKRSR